MNKAKAGEILEILVNLDYLPSLDKLPDGSYRVIIATNNGEEVAANTLKNFQDNNNVTCKARVIEIT